MYYNPNHKKSNEFGIYGIIAFIIMFIFISIIILSILFYTGALTYEDPKSPPVSTTLPDTPDDNIIIPETTAPYIEPEPEAEEVDMYVPVVDIIDGELTELESAYPNTVLRETSDAGQEYIDNIIFLGDSTTHGLKSYKMLKDERDTKQVWTPVNGTLTLSQASIVKILYPDTDEEILIIEAVKNKKPSIMIITLGVNGISFMKEDYFKNEYIKLINSIKDESPNTLIILQSIFPVARSYANQDSINNEKITAANQWIIDIAAETGVKYLNTNSVLTDEEGYLPEEYQNGDGIHFNETAFNIELDYIRTHAYHDIIE